jgi:hypothetical protein
MKSIEVEIDGQHNESLSFRPLPGRRIRGRFDMNRVAEPMARLRTAEWPQPIPGQRLGIDMDGNGYVSEPLHAPEHAPTREKIVKKGMKLAPETEVFEGVDVASWLFWIGKAVASGIAKVVKGELPAKVEGKHRLNFIMAERPQSSQDKLTAAIERQNDLMAQLLDKLSRK